MTPEEALAREQAQLEQIHTYTEEDFEGGAHAIYAYPATVVPTAVIRIPLGQHITPLPHVQRFANDLDVVTGEDSFGTYIGHEPTAEQAVDCFVDVGSRVLGDKITTYAIDHMDKYGIWYVIYRQQIYNPEIGKYWRGMEDRGSTTANHFDHVHLSFYEKVIGGVDNPPPPVDTPIGQKEEPMYVVVRPGERLLIGVPVVNGGGGVKKAAVTVTAPEPGAIIGLAETWRDRKKIAGLDHNPSFKGLVNFDLEAGVEGVEIENLSPGVSVVVEVERLG